MYRGHQRPYDPETGRFISRDPLLFRGKQTNLYAYTFNDPINFIDSDGRIPVLVAIPIIGGAWGGIVGGVTAGLMGGSWGDIGSGAATGFIGGAVAGLGLATGLGAAASTAIGLGASLLTALPDSGVDPTDVGKGLKHLLKPPAQCQ